MTLANPNDREVAVDAMSAELRIEDVPIGTARLAAPYACPRAARARRRSSRTPISRHRFAPPRRSRAASRSRAQPHAGRALRRERRGESRGRPRRAVLAHGRIQAFGDRAHADDASSSPRCRASATTSSFSTACARSVALDAATIRALADRRFGVGCDQVLVVEPAQGDADFRYRIFNADGGEVEQCGNGARCFVVFVRDHGLTAKRELRVETAGGLIVPRLGEDGNVTVDMGVAAVSRRGRAVHRTARASPRRRSTSTALPVTVSVLSMGNPHAVQRVADVDRAPVTTQGPRDRASPAISRAASTRATCRSSIALPFVCVCGSAARAKRLHAEPGPAPRPWQRSGSGSSILPCA